MMKMLKVLSIPVLLAAAGCAGQGPAGALAGQPAPANAVAVDVQNNNWNDVDVYAVAHGTVQRLGTITSQNKADLRIPASLASPDLQLLIVPIGGTQNYLTDVINASPGQTVHLRVENTLDLTTLTVE